MSRTDKRAGRVKYNKGEEHLLELLKKALVGKDWNDIHASWLTIWFLLHLKNEVAELVKKVTTFTHARILKHLRLSAAVMVAQGDGDALQKLGRMINCITKRHCDVEAVEICCAYWKLLIVNRRDFPSGKDLAIVIDEERKRMGKLPSPKTPDAIRERALRLGLKLKGKRQKKI